MNRYVHGIDETTWGEDNEPPRETIVPCEDIIMSNSETPGSSFTRRNFLKVATLSAATCASLPALAAESPFALRYIVASCMYGELPLAEILPEVRKTGATEIDIWPRIHGNQREQAEEMGFDRFAQMLAEHELRLGIITRYDLGPYKLQEEMKLIQQLGGDLIVTGSGNVEGTTEKERVQTFVEKMKPHTARAEELGVTIAIENHGNQLLFTSDSLRYLAEFSNSDRLGIAFAPYHLPQNPELLAGLIRDLGPRMVHFYAWEHAFGCMDPMPKAREMQQLPGYGQLDFAPIVKALRDTKYAGCTSIFMHPVPRGIPILPTAPEVTRAMNRSREYLESLLGESNG